MIAYRPKTVLANRLNILYVRCMNCANTTSVCPGVWKDIPNGIPPRGFFFKAVPVKILIVAKNPGHPMRGESDLFKGRTGTDLFGAYRNYQENYYPDPNRVREPSTRFHKTLFRYVSLLLDIPKEDVYFHAAHTNLVKCSTPDEQAKLNLTTMDACYTQYFRAELELLRPRVLLALGREVERFLIKRSSDHHLPVIYIKHPSYPYRREDEARILGELRNQILAYL